MTGFIGEGVEMVGEIQSRTLPHRRACPRPNQHDGELVVGPTGDVEGEITSRAPQSAAAEGDDPREGAPGGPRWRARGGEVLLAGPGWSFHAPATVDLQGLFTRIVPSAGR